MSLKFFTILLLFISFQGIANEDKAKKLLQEAKTFYTKAKFDTAAILYEQVLKSGYEAPEIYYNLGNSYYKSKKMSLAILNFERAKLLAPNDEDIRFNLELAHRNVVDKIEPLPQVFLNVWYIKFLNTFSYRAWGILSMSLFFITLLLFGFYLYSRTLQLKKTTFIVGIITLVISISSLVFCLQQRNNLTDRNKAIVLTPTITLKSSPDEGGTEIFVLHEGTKVEIVDEVGIWREIKLSNGQKGWLKRTDIEII